MQLYKIMPNNSRKGLKNWVIEAIKQNPVLWGRVAEELNVKPQSLPSILYRNSMKLTQVGVLKILGETLEEQDTTKFLYMQEQVSEL